MPTYDYQCKKCRKRFSVTVSISQLKRVKCPKCSKRDISRIYESFTAITGKKT